MPKQTVLMACKAQNALRVADESDATKSDSGALLPNRRRAASMAMLTIVASVGGNTRPVEWCDDSCFWETQSRARWNEERVHLSAAFVALQLAAAHGASDRCWLSTHRAYVHGQQYS